jgi:hypothetical protein
MAAIIQLACKGIQDNYLTVDASVTFFRAVYKRHTQFAIQTVKNYFTTPPNFGAKYSCKVARCGDLLSKMYLVMVLPCLNVPQSQNYKISWVKKVAFKLVKSVELEFNSIVIEKHYGEWYNIWYSLTVPDNARYDNLIGLSKVLNEPSKYIPETELVIPLSFWFNKSMSLALPLLSLPDQEIKINVELSDASCCIMLTPTNYIKIKDPLVTFKKGCIIKQIKHGVETAVGKYCYEDVLKSRIYYEKLYGEFCDGILTDLKEKICVTATGKEGIYFPIQECNNIKLVDMHLLCDYVLLCPEEKDKMMIKNLNRAYLIEQVLYYDEKILTGPDTIFTLKFSNLCKEVIWVVQSDYALFAKQYFNYTSDIVGYCNNNLDCEDNTIIKKETVLTDNIERITLRSSLYFDSLQPYTYHSNSSPGINTYSFSLYPEELQPSGSINLETISNFGLKLIINKKKRWNQIKLRSYARIYNVFEIRDNLGALMFNNNNI